MTFTRYDTTFANADFMPSIVVFSSDNLSRIVDVAYRACCYDLEETASLDGWEPVQSLGYQEDGVFVTVYKPRT